MTARFRGMAFTEIVNNPRSPMVSRANDRSKATRHILVSWSNVEAFAAEALGYSKLDVTSDGYQFISRVTPWVFPTVNKSARVRDSMYCDQFDYEGYGLPTSSNANVQYDVVSQDNYSFEPQYIARYEKAKCQVSFGTPTYEILSDTQLYTLDNTMDESKWRRFVTKIVRPQGEFLSIAGTNNGYYASKLYTQSTSPFPISTTINKVLAACNYSVTWHQVPADAVPMQEYNPSTETKAGASNVNLNWAIDNCLGRVNDREFNGIHQWTLLLLAAEIKPLRDPYGNRVYDITYMFKSFEPDEAYQISLEYNLPVLSGLGGSASAAANYVYTKSRTAYPGHNHVFLPATRLSGATFVGGGTPSPGWYEVIANSSTATTAPYTNWVTQAKGVNIYDSANFANLFRPVTWSRG